MFKFLRKRQNSHFNSKFKTLPTAPRTQAFTAFTKSTNQKSRNISSKHVISFTSKYILSIYISHFALRILSNIFINIWLSILSVKSFISLNKVVTEWVTDYDQIWVSSAFNKCPLTWLVSWELRNVKVGEDTQQFICNQKQEYVTKSTEHLKWHGCMPD